MSSDKYKAAYERQKLAREQAENALENYSRDLYESNQQLKNLYEKLKNQKSQLLHQEKLASIGQLSAGVAHEINNPVGFIKSNLISLKNYAEDMTQLMKNYQLLIDSLSESNDKTKTIVATITEQQEDIDIEYIIEDLPNLIDESLEGADRITKIVDGLKNFSRIDNDEKEKLDINACIESTLKLVQSEIKYKAELKLNLGDIPLTMGYLGNLSQVILNMLVNASHAMEEFGLITVRTTWQKESPEYIIIEIKDNGSGMSEATQDKIFDPFYTTKDVGIGTGLGLSISIGIIKKHGGTIAVDSELGKGTCFTISLPMISDS